MSFDNNPYLLHSSTVVSRPMSDSSIFTQSRPAPSTFNTPPLGGNKGGTSPLALISMQRHSAPHHQPPLLAIKEEPRMEHRPRLSLSVPHVPGKTRKRHKVATSCNRCRQNKRKCDGGVPCSNCKRNKADCLYTDAQQSRSTWGDLPLSQEKIIGVSASAEDDDTTTLSEKSSKPVSASLPGAAGAAGEVAPIPAASPSSVTTAATSWPSTSRVPKSTAQTSAISSTAPTARSKSPSNQSTQEGYANQSARIPDSFASPYHASTATLTPQAHFIPGHATYEQDFNLDRRKQQLSVQSAQISRAIRVARPGPYVDTTILLSSDSGVPQRPDHSLVRGLSQDSSLVAQGSLSSNNSSNNARPRVTTSQSVPNTLWRQDPGPVIGPKATFSKQQQQQQQPHQHQQTYQQEHLVPHQQYQLGLTDSLEARQTGVLSPAQLIPQYSGSPKREPISAFSVMGQGNSQISSGSSSTHSMMSARVASQPQQLPPPQQQEQQQQRQQNMGTDATSGFLAGPAFPQGLQQSGLNPSVIILNEHLPLYDSPQPFGTPQAHFQAVQQQQDQQFEQQLMLQLPGSSTGTPANSMQQHHAQPYLFQTQPHPQHQQASYVHQPRQQNAQQLPQQQQHHHLQQHHHQQQQESPLGPNHAISSAAPVSSVAIPSGVQPPLEAWANSPSTSSSTPTTGFSAHNNQIDWKSTSISQPTSLDYSNRPFNPQTDPHYSFTRSPVGATTPSTAIPSLAGSPATLSGDYGQKHLQKFRHNGGSLRQQALTTSSPILTRTEEHQNEAARIQKISRDILDCQQYDYCVFLPRHISQEYPDLWVAPHSNQPGGLDGIPRQLLVLPKDANFLVDVFFENACFYYPVLNRMTVELHLMEPHTAHSLFLLNIVFMAACKHLGKSTYIKRAIQFRERARELQYHIDGRVRLSRIQGALLGSQVIYGVFTVVIGFAQLCGTYSDLPTRSNLRKVSDNNKIQSDDYDYNNNNNNNTDGDNETMTDIAEESRKLIAQKGVIPEAAYQQRLWSFWTIYARDSMSRLYFGWPHGIDALAITAELPTIKGSVGLGGRRKGLNGYGGRPGGGSSIGASGAGTGKRRGAAMKPVLPPERKMMKAADKAMQKQHKSERESYRVATTFSDDDDDDDDEDDDEGRGSDVDDDDESDLEQGDIHFQSTPSMSRPSDIDATMSPATGTGEKKGKWSFDGPLLPSVDGHEIAPSISGLSKTFLEKQSRGEDIHRRGSSAVSGGGGGGPGSSAGFGSSPGTGSHSSIDIKRHTERMKLLLDAEDDVTDGGTYSRILFLEEIKLWTIGRRAGLYLMGRSASSSVSPLGAMTGSYSTTSSINDMYGASTGSAAGLEVSDPFAKAINATAEASRCSERAWLEDKELQGLQAELMAWERALPPMFKFRQDVDAPDINHKVNGKLAVLSLFYYTITIMLQSSYLPIPQYLSSSSRSTAFKSPESISQEYDELFSRSQSVTSTNFSDDGITTSTQIKRESGDGYLSPNRFAYLRQQYQHQRNNSNGSMYGGSNSGITGGYFNTAHKICTQLSNVLYHHLELMLDSYPNWCSIQSKLNHSLVAALRVSCLNARLSSNSQAIRDEAKAGFKMGSNLFKRQALLPDPLTIRDWPAEEDVQVMLDLEEEFREMMTTQEEEERSRSHTRDQSEEAAAAAAAAAAVATAAAAEVGIRMVFDEDPGDRLLYIPQNPDDAASLAAIAAAAAASAAEGGGMGASDPNTAVAVPASGIGVGDQLLDAANNPLQYGMFRAEHVFGLGEGFQFDYNIDP